MEDITTGSLSVTDVLAKYVNYLQSMIPAENLAFANLIAQGRLPCEHCFDFNDQDKKLGCRYCHKKGYKYMDFGTEVIVNLISDKIRKWVLHPIQAFIGDGEASTPQPAHKNSSKDPILLLTTLEEEHHHHTNYDMTSELNFDDLGDEEHHKKSKRRKRKESSGSQTHQD